MKKIMQTIHYPVLHINAGSHPLQVFRAAESPRLQVNNSAEECSAVLGALHTHFTYEVFFVVSGKITLITQTEHTDYHHAIVIIPRFAMEKVTVCSLLLMKSLRSTSGSSPVCASCLLMKRSPFIFVL